MNQYYTPSGKISIKAFVGFLLLSLIAFPLMGLLYAYAIWYIPIIYLNLIIAAAFGFGVGWLVNKFVIDKGQVRNVALAVIFGLLGGLTAMYFHWAAWTDLVLNAGESYGNSRMGITVSNIKFMEFLGLAVEPGVMFGLMSEINEIGTWGLRSSTVSGGFLSVIWIVEMIIIVGIATFVAFPKSRQPFCESKGKWFEEQMLRPCQYIIDGPQLMANLERQKPIAFEGLFLTDKLEADHSQFTLYSSGHGENYLSIDNQRAEWDDKGELSFDETNIIEFVALTPQLKEALMAIGPKLDSSEGDVTALEDPAESKPVIE